MANHQFVNKIENLRDEGRLLDAITELKDELKDNVSNATYLNLLTHCLIQNGDLEDATVTLNEAKTYSPDSALTAWNEVRLLLARGQSRDATALALENIALHENDLVGMVVTGACLRAENRIEESFLWFNKALSKDPQNVEALVNKGLAEIARKNNEQAVIDLVAAHTLRPKLKKIWNLIIKLQYQAKNYLSTAETLSNIIMLDHNFENAVELFDTCTARCSDLSSIREKLEKCVEAGAGSSLHFLLMGIIYKNVGDFGRSIETLEKSERLNPTNHHVQNYLGVVAQAINDTSRAVEYFHKSIALNDKYSAAHFNLALSMAASGYHAAAIDSYKKVVSIDEKNFAAYNNLGVILKEQGRDQQAMAAFTKAAEVSPDNPEANYNMGLMLYQSRAYPSAIDLLKKDERLKSQLILMKCHYKSAQEAEFYEIVDDLVQKKVNNAVIGSYLQRAKLKFGISRHNPFCNAPLDYVYTSDLKATCNFDEIFVRGAQEILSSKKVEKKYQPLVLNGDQTAGNVFDQFDENTKVIQDIIVSEIEKYKFKFRDSNQGFIKAWPREYTMDGWLVSMNSGGEITPHIHENGWISGSIYINVPKKVKRDSGNLVLCTGEKEHAVDREVETMSIDVVTGSICLFPSSLLHHTIPFKSKEKRTVLAFDIVPV